MPDFAGKADVALATQAVNRRYARSVRLAAFPPALPPHETRCVANTAITSVYFLTFAAAQLPLGVQGGSRSISLSFAGWHNGQENMKVAQPDAGAPWYPQPKTWVSASNSSISLAEASASAFPIARGQGAYVF